MATSDGRLPLSLRLGAALCGKVEILEDLSEFHISSCDAMVELREVIAGLRPHLESWLRDCSVSRSTGEAILLDMAGQAGDDAPNIQSWRLSRARWARRQLRNIRADASLREVASLAMQEEHGLLREMVAALPEDFQSTLPLVQVWTEPHSGDFDTVSELALARSHTSQERTKAAVQRWARKLEHEQQWILAGEDNKKVRTPPLAQALAAWALTKETKETFRTLPSPSPSNAATPPDMDQVNRGQLLDDFKVQLSQNEGLSLFAMGVICTAMESTARTADDMAKVCATILELVPHMLARGDTLVEHSMDVWQLVCSQAMAKPRPWNESKATMTGQQLDHMADGTKYYAPPPANMARILSRANLRLSGSTRKTIVKASSSMRGAKKASVEDPSEEKYVIRAIEADAERRLTSSSSPFHFEEIVIAVRKLTTYRTSLCRAYEIIGATAASCEAVLAEHFARLRGQRTGEGAVWHVDDESLARQHLQSSGLSKKDYLDLATTGMLDLISELVLVLSHIFRGTAGAHHAVPEEKSQRQTWLWKALIKQRSAATAARQAPTSVLPENMRLLRVYVGECPNRSQGCKGMLEEDEVITRSADEAATRYVFCNNPMCSYLRFCKK